MLYEKIKEIEFDFRNGFGSRHFIAGCAVTKDEAIDILLSDYEEQKQKEIDDTIKACTVLGNKNRELTAENARLTKQLENAVVLPCKVGDKVYRIWLNEQVESDTVIGIYIRKSYTSIEMETSGTYSEQEFDRNWFLTEAEAIARLAELEAQDDRD